MSGVNGVLDNSQIIEILRHWLVPEVGLDLVTTSALRHLEVKNGNVSMDVVLGFIASQALISRIKHEIENLLRPFANSVIVNVSCKVQASMNKKNMPSLKGVKNIIAIASGKGGVGKSTTAVNLALALLELGATVGILDADIYGPSQPLLLGVPEGTRPAVKGENNFVPVTALGLQSMSMGYLTNENTPMVWRGPMASGALQQILMQTLWQDVDYLIVDMPPGTGDIQLTLAQKVPVDGAVIVTTPQDIALLDAKKGIEMFRKVQIPVLGIVENMSIHICKNCGHEEAIFGQGGAQKMALQYQTVVLGQLPLSMDIRRMADEGRPTVINAPQGQEALLYKTCAQKIAIELWVKDQLSGATFPTISISND